ncbi:unnamed protein product [Microthlaspi erraticum]|uniref:Uncharacterized protein n=1 Tax=Microthlaspi erraticum TaxID=1685480 RepID=A0A6D2KI89_9BRAS|nr:unnamed protein product [Microthlaspi erraticum]
MVKWYKKTVAKTIQGIERLETEALMVFKLDGKGNAVYTQDIGDLVIFLTKSEPLCVPASSFPTCVLTASRSWMSTKPQLYIWLLKTGIDKSEIELF